MKILTNFFKFSIILEVRFRNMAVLFVNSSIISLNEVSNMASLFSCFYVINTLNKFYI